MSAESIPITNEKTRLPDVTLASEGGPPPLPHKLIIADNAKELGYPCDECNKSFPNNGKAKELHTTKEHGHGTIQYTSGPLKSSFKRQITEAQTWPINCTTCSFKCKSRPTMKKHMEIQ